MIVDASVVLSAYFPDEKQEQAQAVMRNHTAGQERLLAPTLLIYEVTHAVLQATRRNRITDTVGRAILTSFDGLDIEKRPVAWSRMHSLAQRFGRSAYDAAYLSLAEETGQTLITGDMRLYHAVRDDLDWVRWIGDYRAK